MPDFNSQIVGSVFNKKVAYHYNCQSVNGIAITQEPLQLLQMVKGLEIVYKQEPGFCCGYSGDFAANFEEESVKRANKLLDAFEEAGAEVVVSNDYQCLFHFQSITKKKERPIQFMHLAEVLAQGW